jgi:hypothetical protein
MSPSGPFALKRCAQSRNVCRSMAPISAAALQYFRLLPDVIDLEPDMMREPVRLNDCFTGSFFTEPLVQDVAHREYRLQCVALGAARR